MRTTKEDGEAIISQIAGKGQAEQVKRRSIKLGSVIGRARRDG
jgi:hypothetical protein